MMQEKSLAFWIWIPAGILNPEMCGIGQMT